MFLVAVMFQNKIKNQWSEIKKILVFLGPAPNFSFDGRVFCLLLENCFCIIFLVSFGIVGLFQVIQLRENECQYENGVNPCLPFPEIAGEEVSNCVYCSQIYCLCET